MDEGFRQKVLGMEVRGFELKFFGVSVEGIGHKPLTILSPFT